MARKMRSPFASSGYVSLAGALWLFSLPARGESVTPSGASTPAPEGSSDPSKAPELLRPDLVVPAGGRFDGFGLRFGAGGVQLLECSEKCEKGAALLSIPIPEEANKLPRTSRIIESKSGARALLLKWGRADHYYVMLIRGASTKDPAEVAPKQLLKGWAGKVSPRKTEIAVDAGEGGEELLLASGPTVALCGRSVSTMSRAYDPAAGSFRSVRLPPIPAKERAGAEKLSATPTEVPDGMVLVPVEPNNKRSARTPADGNLSSIWEAAHEFVELRLPEGAEDSTLYLKTIGALAEGSTLYLATDKELFTVTLSEPGQLHSIPVPAGAICLSLVQSQRPVALSEVMVAAKVEHETTTVALVARLEESDPKMAAAALRLRGAEAAEVLARAFPRMSPLARGRAEEIALQLSPSEALPYFVTVLEFGDEAARASAIARLSADRKAAGGKVVVRLTNAAPAGRARLIDALILLDADKAARELPSLLDAPSAAERLHVRRALSRLARSKEGRLALARVLGELATGKGSLGEGEQTELLRALGPHLPKWRAEAVPLAERLAAGALFERAYLLLPHVLELAPHSPALALHFGKWLSGNPAVSKIERAALSVRALELLTDAGPQATLHYQSSVIRLLGAENVRVRWAAYVAAARASLPLPLDTVSFALRRDEWPMVRAAAVEASVKAPLPAGEREKLGKLLIRRLRQDSEIRVRSAVATALGKLTGEDTLTALRKAMATDDSYLVRAKAAEALGARCDLGSLRALTQAAHELARAPASEGPIVVGLAAVRALVALGPADLEKRLAPTRSEQVSAVVRVQVERQIESARSRKRVCQAPPKN